MRNNREICGCLSCGDNAAAMCSSMRADTMGGEYYCGNHDGLFVLPNFPYKSRG